MLSTHINAPSLNNQHSKIHQNQEIEECKKKKRKKNPQDYRLLSLDAHNNVDSFGTLGVQLSNCSGDTTVVNVAALLTVRGPWLADLLISVSILTTVLKVTQNRLQSLFHMQVAWQMQVLTTFNATVSRDVTSGAQGK